MNKTIIGWILYAYFILAVSAMMIRVGTMDCAHRYADYVVPLSKIHCEIKE